MPPLHSFTWLDPAVTNQQGEKKYKVRPHIQQLRKTTYDTCYWCLGVNSTRFVDSQEGRALSFLLWKAIAEARCFTASATFTQREAGQHSMLRRCVALGTLWHWRHHTHDFCPGCFPPPNFAHFAARERTPLPAAVQAYSRVRERLPHLDRSLTALLVS